MLFGLSDGFNIIGKIVIILVSGIISFCWINKRKICLEEVIILFLFFIFYYASNI